MKNDLNLLIEQMNIKIKSIYTRLVDNKPMMEVSTFTVSIFTVR